MNVGFRIPSRVESEPVERPFDVRQYLNFVWRHWMFIASVTALAFVIAVVYLARATPLYTATTQVLLERPERAPTDTSSTDYYRGGDFSFIENQLAIIRSDPLLRRVVVKQRVAQPPPSAKEPQSTDASQESPTSAEEPVHSRCDKRSTGRISGVAERPSPGAQYFHHLDGSGQSRAARQRGSERLCC